MTIGTNDDFHDIEVVDDNNLIAYGYGNGAIIKSNNKGESWKKVYQFDSVYLEQVDFPTKDIGFICGNTKTLLRTKDGGKEWVNLSFKFSPLSSNELYQEKEDEFDS